MPEFESLREVVDRFGPRSAIDIALLTVAIFGGLRALSGTRAMTQLRGAVVAVALAVVLGRAFDLTAVNYLVDNAAGLLLVAGVVIFQPEIRRALDRMGRTGLAPRQAEPRRKPAIRAIAEAAATLAGRRQGALIVIERETGLQDIAERGVAVDARVSAELLESIFIPASPLHDMAAVVREDRLLAAGCVLPLSDITAVGARNLGTRHRAGIGITETTDAVAVVVSEETGEVSVALGGQLTPVADRGRLEAVLQWLLEPVMRGPSDGSRGGPG